MSELSRRDFLYTTTAAGAAGILSAVHVGATGAEDDVKKEAKKPVRVAIMGVNGRGRQLISGFLNFPEVEYAYLCDPDENTFAAASKQITAVCRASIPPPPRTKPSSTAKGSPSRTRQTRTVRSWEEVARTLPSGEKVVAWMKSVWPWRVRTRVRSSLLQSGAAPLASPPAIREPSGETDMPGP